MDRPDHRDYYIARAETARAHAREASCPEIAAIHSELAARYNLLAERIESKQNNGSSGNGQAA